MAEGWDKEVDVLVVGSGAGGMLNALVAASNRNDALIIEKAPLWGGSSATSGASIWIPSSHMAKEAEVVSNRYDAYKYIRSFCEDNVPE